MRNALHTISVLTPDNVDVITGEQLLCLGR